MPVAGENHLEPGLVCKGLPDRAGRIEAEETSVAERHVGEQPISRTDHEGVLEVAVISPGFERVREKRRLSLDLIGLRHLDQHAPLAHEIVEGLSIPVDVVGVTGMLARKGADENQIGVELERRAVEREGRHAESGLFEPVGSVGALCPQVDMFEHAGGGFLAHGGKSRITRRGENAAQKTRKNHG